MNPHILDYFRLNKAEFKMTLWLLAILFALGHTFTLIVLLLTKQPSAVLLAGVLLPCILALVFLAFSISDVVSGFDLCLSFGATRRDTLLGIGLEKLTLAGLSSLLIFALTALERAVFPSLWMKLLGLSQLRTEELLVPEGSLPPADTLFVPDFSLDWWWTPLILIGALLMGSLIGACVRRFGRTLGTVLYILWVVLAITSSSWLPVFTAHLTVLLPILLLLTLAGLLWMVHYLLHASFQG